MELGVHLPLMPFGEKPLSLERLSATADAARVCGFSWHRFALRDRFEFEHRFQPFPAEDRRVFRGRVVFFAAAHPRGPAGGFVLSTTTHRRDEPRFVELP